jgi:multiple sugar transport system permease protein
MTAAAPRRARTDRSAYLFVLPVFLLFLVFRFGPALASLVLSFADYEIGGKVTFIGTDNYRQLLNDSVFWKSVRVTAVYTALVMPLTTITALALALLLTKGLRATGIFRALFFLPYITSTVMAAIIWLWIYSPTDSGLLNGLLSVINVGPIGWLQEQATVLPALAIMSTWKGFGYSMMIFVAGILAIPEMYHEAAQIDGASWWQRFTQITLPLLQPIIFFVLVIETIASFQVFDAVYVMTSGGPAQASFTLVYMLYNEGFQYFNFGYASAIGMFLFAAIFVIAMIQRRLVGRSDL